ncbi:uncharacterized protein LOC129379923 isoform X2 [Poeciliopsis prolifica]|uniref:uncharacterized protein LOC129379923 isoform X2 n=1 Tax=Poeciliopsis prolifica TaxID=188132 RepID=UPI0024141500|nr:uncharacterized protein LOC129379923 isoform X2 [Poeciliopsis prolifica]
MEANNKPEGSRMKMMSSILLLLILSSCLCATFVVNVTQSSYQAEEKQSITLEWTFTTEPDSCLSFEFMIFTFINDNKKVSVLFHEHGGEEVSQSQDQRFAGRVQSDKELLKDGRIKLHVSRLRINDSGLYLCEIQADCGFGSAACRLIVRADDKQPESPTANPPRENGGLIAFFVLLLLAAAAAGAAMYCKKQKIHFNQLLQRFWRNNAQDETRVTMDASETRVNRMSKFTQKY